MILPALNTTKNSFKNFYDLNNFSNPTKINLSKISLNTPSKEINSISFKAFKGGDWYGTEEDKKALTYKIQLTPKKIAETIRNAKSLNEGISTNYKTFLDDTKNFKQAIVSFQNIRVQYNKVLKEQCKEILKKNPEYSTIPFVGVISQTYNVISGKFNKEILNDIKDICEDFAQIGNKHIVNLDKMFTDYLESGKALREAIKATIDYTGVSDNKINLHNSINEIQNNYQSFYLNVRTSLDGFKEKLINLFCDIYKKQNVKQGIRGLRKTITIMLGS